MPCMHWDSLLWKLSISSIVSAKSISLTSFLVENSQLTEWMFWITLVLNMKTGLTQWLVFSPKLPSVHSTSMVLLELLRKKMDSACCQLISSMRKLSFSSGFGWFLSLFVLDYFWSLDCQPFWENRSVLDWLPSMAVNPAGNYFELIRLMFCLIWIPFSEWTIVKFCCFVNIVE